MKRKRAARIGRNLSNKQARRLRALLRMVNDPANALSFYSTSRLSSEQCGWRDAMRLHLAGLAVAHIVKYNFFSSIPREIMLYSLAESPRAIFVEKMPRSSRQ